MLDLERQRPDVGEGIVGVLDGGDVELWEDLGFLRSADGELESGEELKKSRRPKEGQLQIESSRRREEERPKRAHVSDWRGRITRDEKVSERRKGMEGSQARLTRVQTRPRRV